VKTLIPLAQTEWIKGDYREAASLRHDVVTIEKLAQKAHTKIESFIEDGLGTVNAFGGRTDTGWQFAFEYYVSGPQSGPNLLLLFKNGKCSRSQIFEVLEFFGLSESDTWWIIPADALTI
jgi:hypothetical protein